MTLFQNILFPSLLMFSFSITVMRWARITRQKHFIIHRIRQVMQRCRQQVLLRPGKWRTVGQVPHSSRT